MTDRTPAPRTPETAAAVLKTDQYDVELVTAVVDPTQVRRPWRSTARTVFQALIGLCVLIPVLVGAAGLDPAQLPWLGVVLAVAAAVTRIMAIPGVETWLRRFLPFLAAAPGPARRRRHGAADRGAARVDQVVTVLAGMAVLAAAVLWLVAMLLPR